MQIGKSRLTLENKFSKAARSRWVLSLERELCSVKQERIATGRLFHRLGAQLSNTGLRPVDTRGFSASRKMKTKRWKNFVFISGYHTKFFFIFWFSSFIFRCLQQSYFYFFHYLFVSSADFVIFVFYYCEFSFF